MKFDALCQGVKKHSSKYSNRESFVGALFVAAGAPLGYSDSYLRTFYTGHKDLTVELKRPYRAKDNIASLTDFFFFGN